ncbi:MAG: hypothetical protein IKL55_07120 [Clostridia bacterium]|nr:hypothetical protein [Clostridia bacterium]
MSRKKLFKSIFFIGIAVVLIFSVYNISAFFTKGKQAISVKTGHTYYSGSDISATVSVKKTKNDKLIDAKIIAELYDGEANKVKNVKVESDLEKGKSVDLSLSIPKDLETGNYTLKITSKSGVLKDSAKIPVNIIKDIKSNVVISLDKGIYKPGDEVNFRALILSKKENTPVENEVSICIYDGNENKVYSNKTKTSEYGIVSGKFKLANEVNSGTYRISIVTESQEVSKNFTVNPYITPKFEAAISTDKETYLTGETAQITVSGKYFFGEPVKGAEVEGFIDEKRVVGFTDESGNFVTTYKIEKAKKINLKFSVTDTSNYMIETNKTITAGNDLFEIEFIPEYSFIAEGVDNEIYVITKNVDGTPIKTYSTVNIEGVSKQVISDENGIGKVILTKNEINELKGNSKGKPEFRIVSEDMKGNKIEKNIILDINSKYGTLIKTDKVKYEAEDDIEISINSKNDVNTNNIYILKNNELIKTVSTQEESVIINLENVTGLVDIVIPNNPKDYSSYGFVSRMNYSNSSNYARRTIFIKPNEKLNIDIKTSKEEYKPGEDLKVNFTTTNEKNETVDSALLVSILDEAILSLAENDLSIDNIKLALEDIVLDDGMTAADVYAMILNDSSNTTLQSLLLKQPMTNPNIINQNYIDSSADENLAIGLLLLGLAIIIVSIYLLTKYEKARDVAMKIIVPSINVIAVFVILLMYLSEFISDYIDIPDFVILLIELVLAIIIYVLYLYKEEKLIFKMIKEFAVYPAIIVFLLNIFVEILYGMTSLRYSQASSIVMVIGILGYFILFTIFHVLNRRKELERNVKRVYRFLRDLIRTAIFWLAICILTPMFEQFSLIIVIVVYVLYRKLILKETSTKMQDGKIIINLNASEIAGMIIGVVMVLIVLLLLVSYMTMYDSQRLVTDSMTNSTLQPIIQESTTKGDSSTILSEMGITNDASDTNGSSIDFDFSLKNDNTENDMHISNMENLKENDKIEKDIQNQENVRNVFLESLAFIPELITKEGNAEVDLKISDNITTWNIQTIGNTKNGNVGFSTNSFKVFKEFFVDFSLPTNSVVTDRVSIPVTLYNYTENDLTINLNVKENDWSKIGDYEKIITIPAKQTNMIYVPLDITKAGSNTLRIETSSGTISDIVEKTMLVKPNGLEINKMVSSGIIENSYSQDLIFNEDAIEGTKNIKIRLYASPIAQAIENIEGMLEMPTGCFEQTSSSLYPDILVLRYLRENNLNNAELENKALEYISAGYQKILTYEVPGTPGGYSLYGDSPAEPVLTAFGLMEISELSKVYEVDENVIKEMTEYLFSVQKSNGTFDYSSTYIGGSASTDKLAMNAYIIWALSEVAPKDSRLEKSIEYLSKEMKNASDSYTLALMANIFVNTEKRALANEVMDELKAKIKTTQDGAFVESSISDYYGTRGKYQNIQTTALTSMALTKLNSNQKTNSEIIKYLQSVKDYRGTWGTTQSTILALKAITDYISNSDIKEQTIVVSLNGEEKKIEIGEEALGVYELDFENVEKENNFSIEMKKGKITYEVIKNYYQTYDKIDNKQTIVISQDITNKAKVNDVITQNITIKNKSDYIENGLVEINIPQGCSVIEESLLALKYNGIIEKYEYNYGKINIYLREVSKEEQIDIKIEYRALYPENITGAAMRVFDYYNPDIEGICSPVNIFVD